MEDPGIKSRGVFHGYSLSVVTQSSLTALNAKILPFTHMRTCMHACTLTSSHYVLLYMKKDSFRSVESALIINVLKTVNVLVVF